MGRTLAPAFATVAVLVGILFALAAANPQANAPRATDPAAVAGPPKVKLVVLLVFDQLRGDFLDKWRGEFGPGGFKRLQDGGAWFTDSHYPFGTTATGPGHSAMLTGAPPARTGIVNNEWYDRQAKAEAYCAGLDRYALVPAPDAKPKWAGTPDRCLSPTAADGLKAATGGRGKVFGLSLKDRSGILPSGRTPDGVYWFDRRFVTSTFYRDSLPKWVAEFNQSGKAESYFGQAWERVKPAEVYDRLAGPDDGPGEGKGTAQGTTFPHPTTGGDDKPGAKYYAALANSPFGNDLLLAFAKACVAAEQLGADDVPDLLTVSFSSNDLVGHTWGPDSHEVLDTTIRSDAQVADLLAYLDATVGQGKYAVIVTADHGICPLPEFSAKQGKDARRVPMKKLQEGAEAHLAAKFGAGKWVEAVKPPYLYLNHGLAKEKNTPPAAVAAELAGWVRTFDGVAAAYTHADLTAGKVDAADAIGQRVKLAFHPDRSGDVYLVLNPLHLYGEDALGTGTNHGSPHEYDTNAPLLVYGPGVKGGRRAEKVTPLHAAPVAAWFLGVTPPKDAVYGLPKTLAGE